MAFKITPCIQNTKPLTILMNRPNNFVTLIISLNIFNNTCGVPTDLSAHQVPSAAVKKTDTNFCPHGAYILERVKR